MTWFRWPLPLLGVVLFSAAAPAQGVTVISTYGPAYPFSPVLTGTSFNYTRYGRRSVLSVSANNIGYGYGAFGVARGATTIYSSVTYSAPVIVIQRPILLGAPDEDLSGDALARRDLLPPPRRDPLPPPRDRADPPREPPAPPPVVPPKKDAPKPPDEVLRPPPRPPLPEADPRAEYARLLGLGREAFAAQEYGRSAQRFRQTSELLPNEPQAPFLLAQALFALGKYLGAADAIHAGLLLRPDWPTQPFAPLELYGEHVAAYPEHLRRLEDTLARHPDDAVLLFLTAYQLWFDGRTDEARPLFQRVRSEDAERFLRVPPGVPVVSR